MGNVFSALAVSVDGYITGRVGVRSSRNCRSTSS